MVTLPPNFTATKFPGYFWNVEDQQLYSIKIHGVLRPLKIIQPNNFNMLPRPAYRVSVKGRRRLLFLDDLKKLTLEDSEVPTV